MANTAYVGAGTTLGTSYYMRRFYAANADARTTTSRSNLTNSTLTGADSHALRRAIRSLGSFTYDDDNETNIKNSVSAFISTYNKYDKLIRCIRRPYRQKHPEKSEESDCRV